MISQQNSITSHVYHVDTTRCRNLDTGRRQEWLVTNGRGGYAMATPSGLLSRRYHGLLVAAVRAPIDRYVLLAKLDATISINGLTYELATNDYPEAVHPEGYRLLESFDLRPFPTWRWRFGETVVEQSLCMSGGEDTTFIRFRLLRGEDHVRITVRPLGTSRHYHQLLGHQQIGAPSVDVGADRLTLHWPAGRPTWSIAHNGEFLSRPDWYYGFVLAGEAERGQDFQQDLFMPGPITATLNRGDLIGLSLAVSTQTRCWEDAAETFETCTEDAACAQTADSLGSDALLEPLVRAAEDFLVQREDGKPTVIAGYPWFGEWGRDTFISLPGLCLTTGQHAKARSMIEGYAPYVDAGMIPNRFPDLSEPPAYNTVDATLWYIHSIDRYLAYTGDWAWIRDRMFSVVATIIEAHEKGTRYNIHAAADGLLAAGEAGQQLTWMDAKVGDWVVTPRIGKPVEINALWYHVLRVGAAFAERLRDQARALRWAKLADKCQDAFNRRFWNQKAGCLFDCVDVDHVSDSADGAIRPNQLFAISLPNPVLDGARWQDVVRVCADQLWTPMGMRTLAASDPLYRPRYDGELRSRDSAYHQGTVWPWLLGPFVTAYVRAFGDSPAVRNRARAFLSGLEAHLAEAGIGSVSEVADADPPHNPGGCPWQAWSVAEPLRGLCEDILRSCPREPAKAGREQPRAAGVISVP